MDSLGRKPLTKSRPRTRWAALGLLLALTAFAVMAVGTASASSPVAHLGAAAPAGAPDVVATPTPVASPTSKPTAEPVALAPATPGAGPDSLIGFLFTPIFQGLFLLLIELYSVTGNIVVAIILMTVMIRLVTVKLSAKQIMSQKRMQIIGPELRELTK
ncbi:MAG TPA: hypothetical protein VF337_10205, partial [Candidatus Limnocylindrales bacterium]